jgi:uncharacterized damage-inducible protein DinB
MPAAATAPGWSAQNSILQSFAVNEKINQLLLANIAEGVWRADPPGGTGRTIAEIFAHIHNVRLMWLKPAAKDEELPEKLEGRTCTLEQVQAALAESAECCSRLIEGALATASGKVKNFRPDAVHFVAYLISHDAHHRGQISQLARQTGHPLPKKINFAMWEWGPLAKSV